jgi:hypothetical protein
MSLDLDAGRFGVFSLLPAVVDAVKVPVVATGELRTGAGSRRRCCGVLLPRKSAPHFCAAPKLRFPSLGRWAARHGFVSPTHGEQEMSVWNGHCPRCGSGPRHPPVLPERRKSAKIRAGSAVYMGNPGLDARN